MVLARTYGAIVLGAAAILLLAGCEQPQHKMADESAIQSNTINCKLCYDEIVRTRGAHPKGPRYAAHHTVVKHMCPDCKTTMEIYTENGKLMVKCPHCAPEGLPCDKCLPPKAGA